MGKTLFRKFTPESIPNNKNIQSYLNNIELFKKHLLLLIYIISDPPIRNTEIIEINFKNIITKKREVFFDQ